MLNCNLCPSYQNCFSSHVKARDFDTFEKEVKKVQFKKDSQIFTSGQTADNMYMIISGEVKLVKENDIPYPVTMYIARQGEFFGIGAMVRQNYITSAFALSDSQVCIFSKYLIDELLRKNNEANQLLIRALFNQIRNISDYSITMISGTSVSKVAKGLLMLMDSDNQISVTKEEIALMIGTTRETVSRTIHSFKRKGFIDIDKNIITVVDKNVLLKLTKESKRK